MRCGRPGFDPWVGKIPQRRERLPTPIFWPGEFCGLYSPWGHKESDMTKQLPLSLRHKGFEVFTSSYVHVQPGNGESYYQLAFTEKDARV